MQEIHEIEYKGNFRSKGKKTERESLQDLKDNRESFGEWCGHMLIEFDEAIDELEEELEDEKDYPRFRLL